MFMALLPFDHSLHLIVEGAERIQIPWYDADNQMFLIHFVNTKPAPNSVGRQTQNQLGVMSASRHSIRIVRARIADCSADNAAHQSHRSVSDRTVAAFRIPHFRAS